jgi:hypothetical protein
MDMMAVLVSLRMTPPRSPPVLAAIIEKGPAVEADCVCSLPPEPFNIGKIALISMYE